MNEPQRDPETEAILSDPEAEQPVPVLPVRDVVLFPRMVVPLLFARPKSKTGLEEVRGSSRVALVLTQQDPTVEDPGPDDLFRVGCLARVMQLLEMPDGTARAVIEGVRRVREIGRAHV